jgi:hypothetical protein
VVETAHSRFHLSNALNLQSRAREQAVVFDFCHKPLCAPPYLSDFGFGLFRKSRFLQWPDVTQETCLDAVEVLSPTKMVSEKSDLRLAQVAVGR